MSTSPIRILHVVFSLEPGGMENGVVNLAKRLDPQAFDVHVGCLERAGTFADRLPSVNQVYTLGRKAGFSFSTVFKLARLIVKLRPQVIHTHNLGPLIYGGLATGLGLTCPILHGEHSLLTEEECSPRRLRQRRIFYLACHRIHTVSEGLREQLIEKGYPKRKITTLLNGVDAERFTPGTRQAARRHLRLPEDARVLGIVARFGPFKRHGLLIGAFNQLAAQFPKLHLLVVGGEGPEKERIHAQVLSSHAKDRIHLAGFQNNLPLYYQAMDLLVVPSINEGLSNVVLEAMSCGTPAIANNTCGNSEIIRHDEDGIIADLNTEEKLVCELKKLLLVPQKLEVFSEKARENVIKNFSLSQMVCNYSRLYREVADRK